MLVFDERKAGVVCTKDLILDSVVRSLLLLPSLREFGSGRNLCPGVWAMDEKDSQEENGETRE